MPEFESADELLRAMMRGRHALVVAREAAQRRRGQWLASGHPAKRQDAAIAALSIGRIDRAICDLDVCHGDLRLRRMLEDDFARMQLDAESGEDARQNRRDVDHDAPPAA